MTSTAVNGTNAQPLVLLSNSMVKMTVGRSLTPPEMTPVTPGNDVMGQMTGTRPLGLASASNHVILSLQEGDIVRLMMEPLGSETARGHAHVSQVTFTGHLLNPQHGGIN